MSSANTPPTPHHPWSGWDKNDPHKQHEMTGFFAPPVSHKPAEGGLETKEDKLVNSLIERTSAPYPQAEEEEEDDEYFERIKSIITLRYISVAKFFIEEMKNESLNVVNAAKLANHLNYIRKNINDHYKQYDDRPLSDVELKTEFENVVDIVVPLINKAIEAAKGGSRNKSRSRKHKKSMKHNKSRNHKKSMKSKKSSKKSKRL